MTEPSSSLSSSTQSQSQPGSLSTTQYTSATGSSSQPQSTRGRQATKIKIRFDAQNMLFDDCYPEELHSVLPPEEWEGVLRKLNTDLNQHIQSSYQNLHHWTTGMLMSCALVVGVFVVPVVWVKTHRHEHGMQEFWKQVREFFSEINRKSFIRRGLEWKVVEERGKQRKRDCYNPVYLYRAELVWRKNVTKSKKELARLGAGSQGSQVSSATAGSVPVRKGPSGEKIKRKSRPPSNIESVREVSPEKETGVAAVPMQAAPVDAVPVADAQENGDNAGVAGTHRRPVSAAMALPARPASGVLPRQEIETLVEQEAVEEAPALEETPTAGLFLSDSE